MSPENALALLSQLGASPWLVRHHELVLEAARALCVTVGRLGARLDRGAVLVGAALHDAGKIVHPAEQHVPGHAHEEAGRALLVANGVPSELARFCITHAAWEDGTLEDQLVALADKLWKGVRLEELERRVIARVAQSIDREEWDVFTELDDVFEQIAADGPDRLERSRT